MPMPTKQFSLLLDSIYIYIYIYTWWLAYLKKLVWNKLLSIFAIALYVIAMYGENILQTGDDTLGYGDIKHEFRNSKVTPGEYVEK